jgi:hypothetical protein
MLLRPILSPGDILTVRPNTKERCRVTKRFRIPTNPWIFKDIAGKASSDMVNFKALSNNSAQHGGKA